MRRCVQKAAGPDARTDPSERIAGGKHRKSLGVQKCAAAGEIEFSFLGRAKNERETDAAAGWGTLRGLGRALGVGRGSGALVDHPKATAAGAGSRGVHELGDLGATGAALCPGPGARHDLGHRGCTVVQGSPDLVIRDGFAHADVHSMLNIVFNISFVKRFGEIVDRQRNAMEMGGERETLVGRFGRHPPPFRRHLRMYWSTGSSVLATSSRLAMRSLPSVWRYSTCAPASSMARMVP